MEPNNSPISGSPENTDSGSPIPISANLNSVPSTTNPANGGLTIGEPSSRKLVGASKRKRGRPRKYDAIGNLHPSYASSSGISSPTSRAVSPPPGFAPPSSFVFDQRPSRARDRVSATSQINGDNHPYYQPVVLGGGIANTAWMDFGVQVITLKAGEDIAEKIFLIGLAGGRSIFVCSAIGEISSVTIRRPGIAGGVISYEGRYHLLTLNGSYQTTKVNGVTTTTGGITVSLAGADGKIVGGFVDRLLIAATPIQLVIGIFKPQAAVAIPASPDAMHAEIPILQPAPLGNGVGAPAVPLMPVKTEVEDDDNIIELEVWGNESQPPPQERMYPDINVAVPDGDE